MKKAADLVEQEYGFLEKEWRTLRIGWFALVLFVLAGVLGLFGDGPLSKVTSETSIGVVRYERFLRHSSPSAIIIESELPLNDSSVYINRNYLKSVKIEQIEPRPVSASLTGDRVRFRFGSRESRQIIFHISPYQGSGTQPLELGISGKKEVFNQFIYH